MTRHVNTRYAGSTLRIVRMVVSSAVIALVIVSCDKSLAITDVGAPLQPSSVDASAGAWRMIVMTGPDQVAVPAPAAATSDVYRAEVAAVKSAQGNMTDAQRHALAVWSAGGVLHWNEIERGLVARYNLPPAPGADGTYPAPDPENPFGYPQFPFANPPYASRAYSYVSVAQYEALKAAWYWKYKYNRPSPARVDASVTTVVSASDLPGYPSEDAVLSGVTAEMLKSLFPGAVEEITKAAAEQRDVAMLSGRASASDLAAGLALGKAVATLVLARAANDGMKNAVGTPALWQSQAAAATARGEIAWLSQESPVRPGMLANFGQVKAWTMTPAEVVAAEPPPPPSTASQQMKDELAEVKNTVNNLSRDQVAIALKWNDGVGTPTPPGHWNAIASDYVRSARMSEVRAARAFALLNMAMHDVAVGCWDTKYRYYNPRPAQLDSSIKTFIGLPNFPSYPSGHSTFSSAAATTLGYLFPDGATSFNSMAAEAGMSRLYGGIHYRSDINGGSEHGKRIGAAVVSYARVDGSF
jgi:hypothetical protein